MQTGLVEQHDFAFGTSSRSSRLLHGGLRYLAQGRLGLVHEASVEKKIIHYIAPHLTNPLPFIVPTYRGNKRWVLWQLKIGVRIYDLLCGGRNFGNSTCLQSRRSADSSAGTHASQSYRRARIRLVGPGRVEIDHVPIGGGTDRESICNLAASIECLHRRFSSLPHCRRTFVGGSGNVSCERSNAAGIWPPRSGTGLCQRMGCASRQRDVAPHQLAQLPSRRHPESRACRGLDGGIVELD